MHVDDVAAVASAPPRSDDKTTSASVHPLLTAAFNALEEAGVPWVLLRGSLELAQPSGDVDLLVDRAALPRLDAVLDRAGLRRLGSRGHGSHRFYFTYQPDEDLWITLDVVSVIEFGPFQHMRFPVAAAVLGRRRPVGPLWRPAPDDEAWLFLLHLLLDKGGVAPERWEPARAAAAQAQAHQDGPVATCLDRHIWPGAAARIPAALLDQGSGKAEELARELAQRWTSRQPFGSRWRRSRNRVLRRLEMPIRRGARGLVVALVGPDGAGKTTVADAVRVRHPLPSRTVHMGIWRETRWNRPLARIPAGAALQRTSRIVRGSLATRYHRARGRLVLLDRFAHDVLLPGVADTGRGGRLNRKLSLWLAPDPQLVLLLDAPGELMFARKGEHSPEVLEERRQGYLAMIRPLAHGVVLDATRPLGEVTGAASAAIWQTVAAGRRTGTAPQPSPARSDR